MTWDNEALLYPEEANPHQPYSGPAHHKFRYTKFGSLASGHSLDRDILVIVPFVTSHLMGDSSYFSQ